MHGEHPPVDSQQDLLGRHLYLYRQLEKSGRWKLSAPLRRLVSLTLAATVLEEPSESLERAATILRKKSGWFGPLSSPLRYVVAALILRRGLDPGEIHDRVVSILADFKREKLRWGGCGRILAAVHLALRIAPDEVPVSVYRRMKQMRTLWKADHPLITGDDDFPMLAFHSLTGEPIDQISNRLEETYQELRRARLPRGNQLQLTTQILGVFPWSPSAAAGRFLAVREAFEVHSEKIKAQRFDEVALLALASAPPDQLVSEVLQNRDRLRSERPRPGKELAFSIAAGLLLARLAEEGALQQQPSREAILEMAPLNQIQQILAAQQAAMSAAMVATIGAHTS